MPSHFYAYMARMKHIRRWGLNRSIKEENDQEHALQTAMIAHALAVIRNTRYGGHADAGLVVKLAIFHDASEVITGDLAAPIKYFNPGIRDAYKSIERMASEQLYGYLPDDFREEFYPLLFPDETSPEWKLVKAADKMSAYLKCVEEAGYGNVEFDEARQTILKQLTAMGVPEVDDFLSDFAPSFSLSLDGLN